MYYKNIEDAALSKGNLSDKEGFLDHFRTKKSKLITSLLARARGCGLQVDEENFPLRNLSEQELVSIIGVLDKLINQEKKGLAAAELLGMLKSNDASGVDSGMFYVKTTPATILGKVSELNRESAIELEKVKKNYDDIIGGLKSAKKELEKNIEKITAEKDQLFLERNNLLNSFNSLSEVNDKLKPLVKITNKASKNYKFTFDVVRDELDAKLKAYDEEILKQQQLLEEKERAINILNQSKEKILKYLVEVDKYLDKNQQLINGNFKADDENIREILAVLKEIINKKIAAILELNKTLELNKHELILKNYDIEKLKSTIVVLQKDIEKINAEHKAIIEIHENYKTKVSRVFNEIKERAKEHGILISVDNQREGKELIWDDHLLIKKNQKALEDLQRIEVEKANLEKQLATLVRKSIDLELEQKTIANEIDSIFEELSRHEKNMDRAHLEEVINDPHYAESLKTKKAKRLADKLSKLLAEKAFLDKELGEYKQRIASYEQKLAELGSVITRSLLLTYYDETANVLEKLTAGKYRFAPEARQILAIYLCADADKKGAAKVRSAIYDLLLDRTTKHQAQLTKWLDEQVFSGALKVNYSGADSIINISVGVAAAEYVLLPNEEWTALAEKPNDSFLKIILKEFFPLLGIVYKNNENEILIQRMSEALYASYNWRIAEVNELLSALVGNLLTENNFARKHEALSSWIEKVGLNEDFVIGKDINNKNIFINFNPKTAEGFKRAISDNSKLFELFMKKYLLKYDHLIAFLPKQYIFYSNDFQKLLAEENNTYLNSKAKTTFYQVFKDEFFVRPADYFAKPETRAGGYINAAYLTITLSCLFFLVWPSLILRSATFFTGLAAILATIPLYLASLYSVFRKTGKIPFSLAERRERVFYEKAYKEFIAELGKVKNSEELVLEFQQRIPLHLLNERERYTACLTGLLRYFMPRAQRDLISPKFMQENWHDLVCSLMYGSLQGAMGGLPLSVELLRKISELMSMLVILDVRTNIHHQSGSGLLNRLREYYGLKGN